MFIIGYLIAADIHKELYIKERNCAILAMSITMKIRLN